MTEAIWGRHTYVPQGAEDSVCLVCHLPASSNVHTAYSSNLRRGRSGRDFDSLEATLNVLPAVADARGGVVVIIESRGDADKKRSSISLERVWVLVGDKKTCEGQVLVRDCRYIGRGRFSFVLPRIRLRTKGKDQPVAIFFTSDDGKWETFRKGVITLYDKRECVVEVLSPCRMVPANERASDPALRNADRVPTAATARTSGAYRSLKEKHDYDWRVFSPCLDPHQKFAVKKIAMGKSISFILLADGHLFRGYPEMLHVAVGEKGVDAAFRPPPEELRWKNGAKTSTPAWTADPLNSADENWTGPRDIRCLCETNSIPCIDGVTGNPVVAHFYCMRTHEVRCLQRGCKPRASGALPPSIVGTRGYPRVPQTPFEGFSSTFYDWAPLRRCFIWGGNKHGDFAGIEGKHAKFASPQLIPHFAKAENSKLAAAAGEIEPHKIVAQKILSAHAGNSDVLHGRNSLEVHVERTIEVNKAASLKDGMHAFPAAAAFEWCHWRVKDIVGTGNDNRFVLIAENANDPEEMRRSCVFEFVPNESAFGGGGEAGITKKNKKGGGQSATQRLGEKSSAAANAAAATAEMIHRAGGQWRLIGMPRSICKPPGFAEEDGPEATEMKATRVACTASGGIAAMTDRSGRTIVYEWGGTAASVEARSAQAASTFSIAHHESAVAAHIEREAVEAAAAAEEESATGAVKSSSSSSSSTAAAHNNVGIPKLRLLPFGLGLGEELVVNSTWLMEQAALHGVDELGSAGGEHVSSGTKPCHTPRALAARRREERLERGWSPRDRFECDVHQSRLEELRGEQRRMLWMQTQYMHELAFVSQLPQMDLAAVCPTLVETLFPLSANRKMQVAEIAKQGWDLESTDEDLLEEISKKRVTRLIASEKEQRTELERMRSLLNRLRQPQSIPTVVNAAFSRIEALGCITTLDLYTPLPAPEERPTLWREIRALHAAFMDDSSPSPKLDSTPPKTVALLLLYHLHSSVTVPPSFTEILRSGDLGVRLRSALLQLPPHTLAFVQRLRRHLRRVYEHQRVNGMSLDALARAFAPVLLWEVGGRRSAYVSRDVARARHARSIIVIRVLVEERDDAGCHELFERVQRIDFEVRHIAEQRQRAAFELNAGKQDGHSGALPWHWNENLAQNLGTEEESAAAVEGGAKETRGKKKEEEEEELAAIANLDTEWEAYMDAQLLQLAGNSSVCSGLLGAKGSARDSAAKTVDRSVHGETWGTDMLNSRAEKFLTETLEVIEKEQRRRVTPSGGGGGGAEGAKEKDEEEKRTTLPTITSTDLSSIDSLLLLGGDTARWALRALREQSAAGKRTRNLVLEQRVSAAKGKASVYAVPRDNLS